MSSRASLPDAINLTAAVLLPVAWAAVTGLIGFVLCLSIAAWQGAKNALAIGGMAGALVFGFAWLYALSWWRGVVERIVNPEGTITPAAAYPLEAPELHISIDWDEGRAGIFDDLNVSDQMFIDWACEVAKGKSLGENHHTGAANAFSKGQYHAMLDRLEYHGFIRIKGKARTSGYMLTRKGEAVCNELLRRYGSLQAHYPSERRYLPTS
jgi:hypothetical protein